jgi:hypothetical protein
MVEVFNPRLHRWEEHFEVTASLVIFGRTPIGRAAVDILKVNRALALAIRQEEALKGRYP